MKNQWTKLKTPSTNMKTLSTNTNTQWTNMKALWTIITFLAATSLWAQCSMPTDTFDLAGHPSTIEAGQTLYITAASTSTWPTATAARFRVTLDDEAVHVLAYADEGLTVQIPPTATSGMHTLNVCVVDGPWATTTFQIDAYSDTLDAEIDRTDPDPRTQNGSRQDLSTASRRPHDFTSRTHPNGGHGGTLPCSSRHIIDGTCTQIPNHQREWSGIAPMIGRFSHMYLDYCPETQTMYLMNDWLIGKGEYQSNCYNLFGFTTGNGTEVWEIKVTHDTAHPVIVELNGKDVTSDTTIVHGGAFSIGPSPSDTTPHTMYEFGVRVTEGLFVIPKGSDPVEYVPSTTTTLECDKDGVEGYGLVTEPLVRLATFTSEGVTTRQSERYIPTSGVVGLETEPYPISGQLQADTIIYRSGNNPTVSNTCNAIINIDGQLGNDEWEGVTPASGRYSDLYAKYCSGTLHILNDWIHATSMPHAGTCYNLFELYTGNGAEHWGIWVWQDQRRPTVYRYGVDVSDDTTIVHAGSAGWGTSPRMPEPHAIYEFSITTMEGGFVMMYADPGPSSYCSLLPSSVAHDHVMNRPHVYPNPSSSSAITIEGLQDGDHVAVYDVSGRQAYISFTAQTHSVVIQPTPQMSAGRYSIYIVRDHNVIEVPLILTN